MLAISALLTVLGSACPTREAVALHLAKLPALADAPSWQLTSGSDQIRVELSDGRIVSSRLLSFDRSDSCDDRAFAIATLIATWSQDPDPPAPHAAAAPAQPPIAQPANRIVATHTPRGLRFDVAASYVSSLALGSAWAPGGDVAFSVGRGRWLFRADLVGFAKRHLPDAIADAKYLRSWLGVGPLLRVRPGRFLIDAQAQLLIGLVYIDGSATPTRSEVDVALAGGVRVAVRAGPVAPFVGVGLAGWLRSFDDVQSVGPSVAGATGYQLVSIPRLEGLFSVGLAVGSP